MNEKCEVVKFVDKEFSLDVNISPLENTVWITADQMAQLFERDYKTIRKHINNALIEEVDNSTIAKIATVRKEGERTVTRCIEYYNLDMIISVGYRVKSNRGVLFRKWSNFVLKEYMLKGYVINENRTLVTNENYVNLINKVDGIDNRVVKIERKLNSKELPIEKIFYNGEVYDAYSFIQDIFSKANKRIIIIDNYVDKSVLDRLKYKKEDVEVVVYTSTSTSRVLDSDITIFNNQYHNLSINYTNTIHDRFIVIDDNLYHLGASIKAAGKKMFAITKMTSDFIKNIIN